VQSPDVAGGALSCLSLPAKFVYDLIEADAALAFQHLRRETLLNGEQQLLCQICLRAAIGENEIRHNSTCTVGRSINAAWTLRAAVAKAEAEQVIPAVERAQAARRLDEVCRQPDEYKCLGCGSFMAYGSPHTCVESSVHASTECDGKNPLLREVVRDLPGPRRVVCGARWLFGQDKAMTCDKAVGHDTDPTSAHYNAMWGFAWPTASAIAEEMKAAR